MIIIDYYHHDEVIFGSLYYLILWNSNNKYVSNQNSEVITDNK